MTHTPQEQPKREAVREVQHTTVDTPKIFPEVLSSPHDILGKEYEFNGVSFTVLGMDKEFYDTNDERNDLPVGRVTIITINSQRIPVIPFKGGLAHITKIHIADEIITGSIDILRCIVVVEYAPEGWMTNKLLAKELGATWQFVSKLTYVHRQSHPEWFCKYKDSGGRLFEHYAPQLCDLIRNELSEREQVPPEWMTNRGLAKELEISQKSIANLANLYRQTNPEWFHFYNNRKGRLFEHYSPQLCTLIQNEVSKMNQSPEGWMTNKLLAKELGATWQFVSKLTYVHRQSHPEWFCKYKDSGGRLFEHYSPQLCTLIRNEVSKIIPSPDGWMMNELLAKELGITWKAVAKLTHIHRQSNPEWFCKYKNSRGILFEHYSPELCNHIRDEIAKQEKTPLGWMTKSGLAGELKVDQKTITSRANHYRQSNPEWFHLYKDARGRLLEHYSPELCNLIRDKIAKQEEAPLGWMTKNGLAGELRITYKTIMVYTDHYRQSHPDWFHEYKSKSRIAEHYAPQLCDLIRQAVKDKRS